MEAWIGGDLWMKREDMCEEETGFVNKLSNDTMLDWKTRDTLKNSKYTEKLKTSRYFRLKRQND